MSLRLFRSDLIPFLTRPLIAFSTLLKGERMTYDSARDRCVAYGRDLCLYDYLESKPQDNSNKKGYHWTNKDCAVNVKVNS
jgi:hypothetical protein